MMLSDATKNARTWDMKCCFVDKSLFQSAVSAERSISSAVQKDALAFLCILQMSLCWMGLVSCCAHQDGSGPHASVRSGSGVLG